MNNKDSFHILMINPPMGSPAVPPLALAQTASYLAGPGLSIEQYDANLDFFLNHLLTSKQLAALMNRILNRKRPSSLPHAETILADLKKNPEKWTRKITEVSRNLKVLRTEEFYKPESFITALKEIKDLLDMASLAYSPSQFRWGRYTNASIQKWSQAKTFFENTNTNPFLSFLQDRLVSKLANSKLGLLILFVSVPDQLPAALTIAHFTKNQHPDLHIALQSNHQMQTGAADLIDSLLPETDPKPLLKLIGKLGGPGEQYKMAWPDFSGLPLHDYLAPDIVLPFKIPDNFEADTLTSSSFLTFAAEQQQKLNVKGFLSEDTRISPVYMAKLSDEIDGKQLSFVLGLKCDWNTSPGPGEFTAAYKTAVRMIHWQNPKGKSKSLIKTLLNVSKAGIWNHVSIPHNQDRNLIKELAHFMASNPNIAHSWDHPSPISSPFHGPAPLKQNVLKAYAHVTPLPGQSFSCNLNEPAYLLLYLKRHGLKKVFYWRVKDNQCTVYNLGHNITYHFANPQGLPQGYLDEICQMVEAGGSVGTRWVRYNLERAFLIGYALEEGVIIGNSSLKQPRDEYVEAVNKQTGLDLAHYLERGYTSVRPEYRGMGIGTRLLEGLTARADKKKLFSIIGADNVAAQKMALRNNTKQIATFYSQHMGKEVGVWVPDGQELS